MHKKAKNSTSKKINQKAEQNNAKESLEKGKIQASNHEIHKKIETLENAVNIKENNNEIEPVKSETKSKTAVLLKERPAKTQENKEKEKQTLEKQQVNKKEKKEKKEKNKEEKRKNKEIKETR